MHGQAVDDLEVPGIAGQWWCFQPGARQLAQLAHLTVLMGTVLPTVQLAHCTVLNPPAVILALLARSPRRRPISTKPLSPRLAADSRPCR